MELVKVVNTGDKPLLLRHDGLGDITIKPGSKGRIVPLEYATINFGNPGARNEGRNNVRDVEFLQMQTLWGFYAGLMPDADWPDMMPKFQVFDLDDNRIFMLIEDPTGEQAGAFAGASFTERTDEQFLSSRIDELENQLKRALELLSNALPATQVPIPETPAPPAQDQGADQLDLSQPLEPKAAHGEQTERNEQRDELPKPGRRTVVKDQPGTTRVGPS